MITLTDMPKGIHGSIDDPISAEMIGSLPIGAKVRAIWHGGNGPHVYTVRDDLDPWHLYRTNGAVSKKQLLEEALAVDLVEE